MAIHCLVEVTVIVSMFDSDVIDHKVRLSVSTGGGACWVTSTKRLGSPEEDTVILPVLASVPVLAAAVILNWLCATLSNVSQCALLDNDHVPVAVTFTTLWLRLLGGFQLLGHTVRLGAGACVTVMVRVGAPGAVTVIVAVLVVVPVLVVAFILNEPVPVWLNGIILFMVSHV